MFCQKCGSILIPKKDGRSTSLACSCGFVSKKKEEMIIKENVQLKKEDLIEVVDKRIETLPRTKETCPKCKNPEAFYWLVQTRSGDEAETRFFKCVKCAYTWRAY